jgi:hypothetical protein
MPRLRKPHPVLDRAIVIVVILLATLTILCGFQKPPKRDPRCDGAGRYEAMRDADLSGQGLGHACQKRNPRDPARPQPLR